MQQILWGIVKEMLKGKFVVLNNYEIENLKISEDWMMSANMAEEVAPWACRSTIALRNWAKTDRINWKNSEKQRIYSVKTNVDHEKAALKWQESFVEFFLDSVPHLPQLDSNLEDGSPHFQFRTLTLGSRVSRGHLIAKEQVVPACLGLPEGWLMQGTCFALPNSEFSHGSKVSSEKDFLKNIVW